MIAKWLRCMPVVLLCALPACQGELGVGSDNGYTQRSNNGNNANNSNNANNTNNDINPPGVIRFECDPNAVAESIPLRRLSQDQYAFALRDLLDIVNPASASQIWDRVESSVETMPRDRHVGAAGETHGGFSRLDQALQQEHVDVSLRIATLVGTELTGSAQRLETLAGACATDADTSNDTACVDSFIRSFGQVALRRGITDEDVVFYTEVFESDVMDPMAFRDVVAVMLTSPGFLYQVEEGDGAVEGKPETFELNAYEVASRLSFHFWQSMPDQSLLDAAADGSLLDREVYEAQVERMFADAKSHRAIEKFWFEWLWLYDVPPMDGLVGSNLYGNFAGDNLPSSDLTQKMTEEILDLARYYTYTSSGSFDDLFASPYSFATENELAAIYKVNPWTGEGEPPVFPDEERLGLFTRAAFLATGTTGTRPIIKGFFIRQALMCQTPPPPPDNAAANSDVNLREDMTTREIVEEITEQPGTQCASCHLTWMNHLGYPTESFDALGRSRTEQMLFDDAGEITGTKPVDTTATPQVVVGQISDVANAAELTPLLLESGQVHACFSRQYARFTLNRPENIDADGCMLEGIREQLAEGASLESVMVSVALRPEFLQRKIVE